VDPTDHAALVALHNSTNGSGWTDSTNWNNGDPCTNNWYGIVCNADATQRVIGIFLDSNNLTGPLPTELGNLTGLQTLDLFDNGLTGPIPSSLGNLSTLFNLYLNSNTLTGPIPSQLGNLTTLLRLWLDDNKLCGNIPTSLDNLTNLMDATGLDLNNNNLFTNVNTALGTFISTKSGGFGDWTTTQTPKGCFPWPTILPAIVGEKQ